MRFDIQVKNQAFPHKKVPRNYTATSVGSLFENHVDRVRSINSPGNDQEAIPGSIGLGTGGPS
jgi:hypothetical protein